MKKIELNNIQYRFWFDDLLRSDNAYNLAYSFKFQGKINLDYLKQALLVLMQEFEPFHSTIQQDNMHPYFCVADDFELPFVYKEIDESVSDNDVRAILNEQVRPIFDLSKEFPCRFFVLGFPGGYVLLTTFHHLVIDGITIFDFCKELTRTYNALLRKEKLPVHDSLLEQFNESWTKAYSEDEKQADIVYWTNYLENVPLHIPILQTVPVHDHKNKTHFFVLGKEIFHRVNDFCKEQQTTSFRLFSGVWLLVLRYFLQTDELVLDHTVHLRPKNYATLLGSYVNNLPIKVNMEAFKTFHELLAYLRENRHQEREHQRAIYTDVVSSLRNKKQLTETSELFNIGIDYPIRNHSLLLPFADTRGVFFYQPLANLIGDMCLVIEDDDMLTCSIRYKNSFDESFIESLASAFVLVLKQIMDKPNMLLSDITYISKESAARIIALSEASLHKAANARPRLFLEQLEEVTYQFPQKVAIRFNGQSFTYQEINEKSNQIAQFLLSRHITNQYIGIAMSRGMDMIVTALAIWKSGNTYVPLDLANPLNRLKFIIQDCNIHTLFVDDKLPLDLEELQCITLDEVSVPKDSAKSFPFIRSQIDAYVIYTSGTTGKPKGIPITHGQMANALKNECEAFQIGPDSIVLQFASINFDASVAEIFTTLSKGGTLVVATDEQQKDPSQLLRLLERERISCATIPPALLTILPQTELPLLKTLIVGGESTQPGTIARWKKERRLINAYGPTENTVDTAINVYGEDSLSNDIGCPISGVTCYVLDQKKRLLPDFVPGELYIGGYQLTNGYLNRPELNKQQFFENPFVNDEDKSKGINTRLYRSGDMVMRLPNGHILFLGRTDFQVKIRGLRIELREIENQLIQCEGVEQAFVTTIMVNETKQLAAFVQGKEEINVEKIRGYLMSILPSYMVPNYWSIIDVLPLTINGKVDTHALPAPRLVQQQASYSAPQTTAEYLMADIVSSILKMPNISIDDNLFDLGMNSLQVMETVFELVKVGIHTTVSTFYKEKTIRKILLEKKSLYCYWGTNYDPNKPLLLIVCGYAYYKPYYDEFTDTLKDKYSILVIESYHEYFFNHESCTLKELIEVYMNMLRPVLKGKTLFGITGVCFGGEIGLQLAYYLSKENIATPKVFVIDGFAGRGSVQGYDFIDQKGVDIEVCKERNRITDLIEESFFFNVYAGDTYICLADTFSPMPRYNLNPEDTDPAEIERAFHKFSTNPGLWKQKMPHCKISYIKSDHWNIVKHDQCQEIKQIIDDSLVE